MKSLHWLDLYHHFNFLDRHSSINLGDKALIESEISEQRAMEDVLHGGFGRSLVDSSALWGPSLVELGEPPVIL